MLPVFSRLRVAVLSGAVLLCALPAVAQSQARWRKSKPLPPAAKITVNVEKAMNGKPISNAAVIFHVSKNGRSMGNMEVKSGPDGNASIDIIEIGSHVQVQVIAEGFATAAQEFDVPTEEKSVSFKMQRPRAQVSVYENNDGKASDRPAGVQEPKYVSPAKKPKPAAAPADASAPGQPAKSSTPQ
jgi:hypothetical protein